MHIFGRWAGLFFFSQIDDLQPLGAGVGDGESGPAAGVGLIADANLRASQQLKIAALHTPGRVTLLQEDSPVGLGQNAAVGTPVILQPASGLAVAGQDQLQLNKVKSPPHFQYLLGGDPVESPRATRAKAVDALVNEGIEAVVQPCPQTGQSGRRDVPVAR